jgi:hypothetical protein
MSRGVSLNAHQKLSAITGTLSAIYVDPRSGAILERAGAKTGRRSTFRMRGKLV